jgi:hypothetical protein
LDVARGHYLGQIAAVKAGGKVKTRNRRESEPRMIDRAKVKGRIVADNATVKDTPLEMLKQRIRIDPGQVAAMRAAVHHHRTLAAQQSS